MGRVLPARWYRKRAQLHFNLLYGSVDIYSQKELYEKYKKNEKSYQIIGITSATLVDKCRDASVITKDDLTHTIFDITTRKDSARILLTNSTGATRYLSGCMIYGKLIKRFSDKDGFIHDSFVDYESIRKNGERKLEIGNNFICLKTQVEQIADYHAKFNRGPKHIYSLTLAGTRHYYEPGEWYTLNLNITTAGIDELMNMVCRCMSVSIERSSDGLGTTEIILEEVIENWTYDSNSVARFMLSGNLEKQPTKEKMIVAASDYDGVADYYCDGTADEVEINKAIVFMAGRGGGIVELSEGTFIIIAAIELKSNIVLQGRGANTILEKNCNDYAIEAIGTSGTYLENILFRNCTVTRNASDTNAKDLIYFEYCEKTLVDTIYVLDSYVNGIYFKDSKNCSVLNCRVLDNKNIGYYLDIAKGIIKNNYLSSQETVNHGFTLAESGMIVEGNQIYEYSGWGISVVGNNNIVQGNKIENVNRQGVSCHGNYNNIIANHILNSASDESGYAGVRIQTGAANINVGNNLCIDNGNLIVNGICEIDSAPYIVDDAASVSNASVARDDTEAYGGTYSNKLTITATGSEGIGRLADNATTTDMHGLVAGKTYQLTAWVFVPSTGGPAAAEVKLRFSYYDSAAWTDTEAIATGQDAWEELDCGEVTIPATATGIKAERLIDGAASNGEFCYFDNLRLQPIGIFNDHDQNYKDTGADTYPIGNSWQGPGA